MMPGTLILCATPIGNLGDVSTRLTETLGSVDVIYAEDTRRTGQLLRHLGISVPMRSFFAGNERSRLGDLQDDLTAGSVVALVTDAGTPVVSDPGATAVAVAASIGAAITAIPGPSAVTMAIALSGFDGDRFVFAGFLPRKGAERAREIVGLASEQRTAVVFLAPSRVAKDLEDLRVAMGDHRRVVIARELTKLHEEVWRGTLAEAHDAFSDPSRQRGEFTIVLEGAEEAIPDIDDAVAIAHEHIAGGATPSDAVREVAGATGVSRRVLYDRVVRGRP